MDFERLSELWNENFKLLAEAGKVYDPREWERRWGSNRWNSNYSAAKWVLKFLSSAVKASDDSTCLNRHAGSVIVDIQQQRNGTLIPFQLSEGSNGAPAGIVPCTSPEIELCRYKAIALKNFYEKYKLPQNLEKLPDDPELKKEYKLFKEIYHAHCPAIHSEEKAINLCPVSVKGKMLFATTTPCTRCAGTIVDNGIAAVVYSVPYKLDPLGKPSLALETEKTFRDAKVPLVYWPIPEEYYEWLIEQIKSAGRGIPDPNDVK